MAEKEQGLIKAVIHLIDKKLIKGYLADPDGLWSATKAPANAPLPEEFDVQLLDGSSVKIRLCQAKAVFFVNQFHGQPEYEELKFFKSGPDFPGLWVRLRFADSEVTEGLVHNSLSLLHGPGFFLKPPDPQSNNRMVYALKNHLINFEVLGLKSDF